MKRFLSLSFLFITVSAFAQTPYIDYEAVGNSWAWTVFSQGTGGMYDVVSNPDPGGINTSDSVAMLVIDADGDPWGGVWSDDLGELVLDATNSTITIMVYKNVTSRFNLKLEPPNVDHFDSNTVVNQWQQLVFDYSADIGDTATRLTVIPDQPDEYPRSYGSTNYWDNIDFSGTIVPVELTSFTGKYVGNTVLLNWSTATELNNLGFDIQRSIAGKEFVSVGFVQGKGTTTEKNNYSYVDNSISPNTQYSYRLKQIDFDGSYSFAGVVNLGKSLPLNFDLAQNYPNPFNPTTKISFSLPINSNVSLDLYNLVGQKVKDVYNGALEAGSHTYEVNGSDLSSGIYVYRLSVAAENGTNFVASKKMTLLK
jgi:hypothetical protein